MNTLYIYLIKVGVFFGRGFGNSFELDLDYYMGVSGASDLTSNEQQILVSGNWQNADSLYIPALYCGGIYFFILLLFFVFLTLRSVLLVRRLYQFPEVFDLYSSLIAGFIYMVCVAFFGNFLLDRFGAPLFFSMGALLIFIACRHGPFSKSSAR